MSIARFRSAAAAPPALDGIVVSESPALKDALDRLQRVATTDTTVLITGETGTGKELIARAIHRRSRRSARPLVAVNLSAIPETLVAAELFGHEPGAFTGAVQRRIGRFEAAAHGTLFLDEVSELSHDMQLGLLRVLQEGEFERLGGSETRHVDVRVIAAANRDLEAEVDRGPFRADLYYRLSVFPIHLPPLRQRREDIPLLATHFLCFLEDRIKRRFEGIEAGSLARLQAYSWPGNIRELENVIEQSAILCDEPQLRVPPDLVAERGHLLCSPSAFKDAVKGNEQHLIEQALEATAGRVAGASGAAARLGLPASTLESKIRKLNIDKLRYRSRSR